MMRYDMTSQTKMYSICGKINIYSVTWLRITQA